MAEDAPPDVVDAHTHAFPPEWVLDRSELVRRDRWFGELYAAATVTMIDAASLLLAMDAAGVAQAVVCGWPWADSALCRAHNDYLAAAAAASGGRLAWLGVVAPGSPDAAAETERCLELSASGIGELNADAQGFDLTRAEPLTDVVAVLNAAERPLMLHASEPVGRLYLGKGAATPDRLIRLIEAFPHLSLVLAHWGGGLPFYELMPEIAAVTRNVAYDTAASTYLYRADVFRAVIDIVGPERVLWGSDHPVLGMRRFLRQTRQLANLRPEEERAIMAGNARRVYRLPEQPMARAETMA